MQLAYLDTSAYVKLPLGEPEEQSLRAEMAQWGGYVSSALLGVEAIRSCSRYGRGYADDAREWLLGMTLLPIENPLLDEAALLQPAGLRSLDALHLATALSVREDLGAFFTYDARLAAAASDHGLNVIRPS